MNKKGFTLVEILAVVVILSLIITIVATNGFGAFNNTKEKIQELNVEAINQAAELLKVDIENCDDDLDEELIKGLLKEDNKTCSDLYQKISSSTDGFNVDLDLLKDQGYLEGNSIEETDKKHVYSVSYKLEDEKIEYEGIKKEEKKAMLAQSFLSDIISKINKRKQDIVEIHFLEKVENGEDIKEVKVEKDASNTMVYAWIKSSADKYILYIGSEGKIYAPKISENLFSNFQFLNKINFDNFDTSNVTNMSYMFSYCYRLETLNLSGFDTSNVTNMSGMFSNSHKLTSIDLTNFNTSNVTDMSSMFFSTNLLKTLDLTSFDTSNVTNMSNMFYYCESLQTLDLHNFVTYNVTNMSGMFQKCKSLNKLILGSFSTEEVDNMSYMFSECSSLINLDLYKFKTRKVTNMSGMFMGCSSLKNLNISNFETRNVTNMSSMFMGCSSLENLNISNFETRKVTNMSGMFMGCSSLNILNLSNFETLNVLDMSSMFKGCTSLNILKLNNFREGNPIPNINYMFDNCSSLRCVNLKTSLAPNIYYQAKKVYRGISTSCY